VDINVIPLDESDIRSLHDGELSFGKIMANRMFSQWFTPEHGWHEAKIGPYEKICLDPATAVFHYGQEIFEGPSTGWKCEPFPYMGEHGTLQ